MKQDDSFKEAVKIVLTWYEHYSGQQKSILELMKLIEKVSNDTQYYLKRGKMPFKNELLK